MLVAGSWVADTERHVELALLTDCVFVVPAAHLLISCSLIVWWRFHENHAAIRRKQDSTKACADVSTQQLEVCVMLHTHATREDVKNFLQLSVLGRILIAPPTNRHAACHLTS